MSASIESISPFPHRNSFQSMNTRGTYSLSVLSSSSQNLIKNPLVTDNIITLGDTPDSNKNFEYVSFQQRLLGRLGYFGISTTKVSTIDLNLESTYQLQGNTYFGIFMYYILHLNVSIKAVFLTFLITGYFGPVDFLDKIASLDYILCTGLVVIGAWMFLQRYPFYEILQSTWKLLNTIFVKHGCPEEMKAKVDKIYRIILAQHLIIIFGGCTALMIQYFPDPKYCNFTYSTFQTDNWPLRLLFGIHEFFFMMMAWNGYAGPSTMCMYQGVAMSVVIDRMNDTLRRLYHGQIFQENGKTPEGGAENNISPNMLLPQKIVLGTKYNIEKLLSDYRQLMLISDRFNSWVAYKTLFLHICGGSQFVSDVFAATHVLRLPGTGFLDVWFYIWDCMSAGFMLLRVYHFMGMVSNSSEIFLASFKQYRTFPNPKKLYYRKLANTLKIVSLNVGPCQVWPESVLSVLDTMGNYYVCAALW